MHYSKKAYRSKGYYNSDTSLTTFTEYGGEIPLENAAYEFTVYPMRDIAVLSIKRKQEYPKKLKNCSSLCELAEYSKSLLSFKTEKNGNEGKFENNGNKGNANKQKKQLSAEAPPIQICMSNSKVNYLCSGKEVNANVEEGYFPDPKTGEIHEFKSAKNLRRNYKSIEDPYMRYMKPLSSLFVTFTTDTYLSFEEAKRIGRAFEDWVLYNFGIDYGLIAYEPHQNGSWHFHAPLNFGSEVQVKEFEDKFYKWRQKYMNNQGTELSDKRKMVQVLKTAEDIMRVLAYLNPTVGEKRSRIPFYAKGSRVFCTFGKSEAAPKSAYVRGEDLQELLKKIEAQQMPSFNTSYIVCDEDGLEIHSSDTIYYNASMEKMQNVCENILQNKKKELVSLNDDQKVEEKETPPKNKTQTEVIVNEELQFASAEEKLEWYWFLNLRGK